MVGMADGIGWSKVCCHVVISVDSFPMVWHSGWPSQADLGPYSARYSKAKLLWAASLLQVPTKPSRSAAPCLYLTNVWSSFSWSSLFQASPIGVFSTSSARPHSEIMIPYFQCIMVISWSVLSCRDYFRPLSPKSSTVFSRFHCFFCSQAWTRAMASGCSILPDWSYLHFSICPPRALDYRLLLKWKSGKRSSHIWNLFLPVPCGMATVVVPLRHCDFLFGRLSPGDPKPFWYMEAILFPCLKPGKKQHWLPAFGSQSWFMYFLSSKFCSSVIISDKWLKSGCGEEFPPICFLSPRQNLFLFSPALNGCR